MKDWLYTQAAELYEEGIFKLVKCYDKWLNLNRNYIEKTSKKLYGSFHVKWTSGPHSTISDFAENL